MQRHASRHRRPRDPQRDRAVTTRSGSRPESARGWEELRDSERIYAPTMTLHVCYRTAALPAAAAGPAASGPEEHIKTFSFRGY